MNNKKGKKESFSAWMSISRYDVISKETEKVAHVLTSHGSKVVEWLFFEAGYWLSQTDR